LIHILNHIYPTITSHPPSPIKQTHNTNHLPPTSSICKIEKNPFFCEKLAERHVSPLFVFQRAMATIVIEEAIEPPPGEENVTEYPLVIALTPFTFDDEGDELNFAKGDYIDLIANNVGNEKGQFLGRGIVLGEGKIHGTSSPIGWFPMSHVKIVPHSDAVQSDADVQEGVSAAFLIDSMRFSSTPREEFDGLFRSLFEAYKEQKITLDEIVSAIYNVPCVDCTHTGTLVRGIWALIQELQLVYYGGGLPSGCASTCSKWNETYSHLIQSLLTFPHQPFNPPSSPFSSAPNWPDWYKELLID